MVSEKRSPQKSDTPGAKRAKKAREAKELSARIEKVASGITDLDLPCDVPAAARAMLAAGAGAALRTATEERHPLQKRVVDLLADFVQNRNIYENLQAKVADAKSAVDKNETELKVMNDTIAAAGVELAAATSALEAEDAKLSECERAVNATLSGQKNTKVAKKGTEKARAAIEKDKAKYTTLDSTLKTLIDGTLATEKETQKTVGKLIRDLQKLGAEDALTTSAPASLLKSSSERQGFDTVIIGTVKDFIASFIKKDDEKLSENEADSAKLDAFLKEQVEVTERALAASQEQGQQRAAAQEKETAKSEAVAAAEAALTAGKADLVACHTAVTSLGETAFKFDEILAEFKLLAAWTLVPPPEEPVAEVPVAEAPVAEQDPAETVGAA